MGYTWKASIDFPVQSESISKLYRKHQLTIGYNRKESIEYQIQKKSTSTCKTISYYKS